MALRSGQKPSLEQLDMDNRDDLAGPYQGGGWDKGRGNARSTYGGPKHAGPPIAAESSAELPPRGPAPRPLGHRHLPVSSEGSWPDVHEPPRCLICGHAC